MMPKLRPWLLAARPRTLPASIVPVLVGTTLAARYGKFHWLIFLATLSVSLLLQIGANFANDVFDFLKGADQSRRGPLRVTQSGMLSARQMMLGTLAIFGVTALIGLYLVYIGGWPLFVVGVLAILSALAYTGGPWPLGYHGLGDLFVFIFFGVVAVVGAYYLQTGEATLLSFVVSIPVGLLITNILVVNNLRDIETDRAAHKRTLAVRMGEQATRAQFVLFLVASYAIPLALWLGGALSNMFWLPWLSAPLAYALARDLMATRDGPVFNRLLARAAQLNLVFGALFAGSLIV
jgi:1,4-dihydroxy-2-naphthoate polyprenyltransferase